MGTADKMLELIYSWMEQRGLCASQLRNLAKELESIREKCNIAEIYGSTYSVVGAAGLLGASAITLLTGGAAAPLIGLTGAVCSGLGVAVSVASKITQHFLTSGPMKKAVEVEDKANGIKKEIEQLLDRLKAEARELNPSADQDEVVRHVMVETLRAVARRIGLEGEIVLDFVDDQPQFFLTTNTGRFFKCRVSQKIDPVVMVLLAGILSIFTFEVGGEKFQRFLAEGVKQAIKLATIAGFKETLKGGVKVMRGAAGGAVGMVFSLPEAIDNWTEMIKENHVTQASQSLKDTANSIDEMTQEMSDQLHNIKKSLELMAERQREAEIIRQREERKDRQGNRHRVHRQRQRPSTQWELSRKGVVLLAVVAAVVYLCSGWFRRSQTEERGEDGRAAVRVGLLSVCPLCDKKAQISALISQNKLDVFLTTETGLRRKSAHKVLHEASPENFSFYYQAKDGREGGVAIQFSEKLLDEFILFDFITTFQYVATELQHPQWRQPVLIINVFRPAADSSVQLSLFLSELQTLLEEVSECYDSVLLSGDFNLQSDEEMNSSAAEFEDLLRTSELVQHQKDMIISRNVEVTGVSVQDDGGLCPFTTFNARPRQNNQS